MLASVVPFPAHDRTSQFEIVMWRSKGIKPTQSSPTARIAMQISNGIVGPQSYVATQIKLIRRRSAIARRRPVHSINGIIENLTGLSQRNGSQQLDANPSARQQVARQRIIGKFVDPSSCRPLGVGS